MDPTLINKVKKICSLALDAKIDIKELHSTWPSDANKNSFYRLVFEDLEDGIEHAPGYFLKAGVDLNAWKKSEEFLKIYLDCEVLKSNLTIDEMILCREKILFSKKLDQEIISREVKEFC